MRNRKLPFETSCFISGCCGVGLDHIELLMQQRRLVPERWRNVAGQIGHHRL
ncbi:unnamed protein product [Prunus armeniaca]